MAAAIEKPAEPGGQKGNAADEKNLQERISAAQKVVKAQSAADALKEQAKSALNPKERMRYLQQAYEKEIEAHGQSKFAKRLQSGAWQGAAAGGGIGGGIAMGLGTVVGTLVTGVTSIPTVLVGGLVGAGVGAINGPFIKLGLGGGKKNTKPMSDEEMRAEAMQEANRLDEAVERGANTIPQPPSAADVDGADSVNGGMTGPKRKPRKLEVRSVKDVAPETPPEKRKPKKLEMRSAVEPAS